MENKKLKFQRQVKENRKRLLEKIKPSTLTMYAKGNRIPDYDTAKFIAKVIGVPVKDIPYRKVFVNP